MKLINKYITVFGITVLLFGTNELFCPFRSLGKLPFGSPFRFPRLIKSPTIKAFMESGKRSFSKLPEARPTHLEIYYGDDACNKSKQEIVQEVRPKAEISDDFLSMVGSANKSIEIIYDGEMDPRLANVLLCQADKGRIITIFMNRRVFCSDINYQSDRIFIEINKHKNVEIMVYGNFLDDDTHPEMVMTYNYFVFSVDSIFYAILAKKIRKLSEECAQLQFQHLRQNSWPLAEAPYLWPTTQ